MKRKILIGITSGVLLFGGVAFAGGKYQKIEVFFERINVAINGQQAELGKDSILYNGTVYVPLRSMGEMMDAEVSWDNVNRTVHLDFLKDRKDEVYQASTQGLYQYIAMENNRILSDMIRYFKSDDMESMKQVIEEYARLQDLATDMKDDQMALTLDKMGAAIELLRSGWANKDVDDYTLAWTIYYMNAEDLNEDLKNKVSGNVKFEFEVNEVNN